MKLPGTKLAALEVTTRRAEGKLGVAVGKYLVVRYHILLGEKVAVLGHGKIFIG